jgi:hypothetical protein
MKKLLCHFKWYRRHIGGVWVYLHEDGWLPVGRSGYICIYKNGLYHSFHHTFASVVKKESH